MRVLAVIRDWRRRLEIAFLISCGAIILCRRKILSF